MTAFAAAAETQPPLLDAGAVVTEDLCGQQKVATIGQPVPIIFARRISSRGGVMVSPPATDARFSNDASNTLTASYHLILGDGPMGSLQVRDVYQCACRVGSFTQTYDQRAGDWSPGNFLEVRAGYTLQDVPDYCGSMGTCKGLTTVSFTNTYPNGSTDWKRQVQTFVRSGRTVTRLADSTSGPSSNFADLFKLAMEISANLPSDMIDTPRLQTAALFLDANQFYCDIEVSDSNNLPDFIAAHAPYFLLRETRVNGKRGLRPLLPIDGAYAIRTDAIPWEFEFNEDYVLPGSISLDFTPLEQRKPVLMVGLWRQQPDDSFGIARTAEVGYPNDRASGNIEQHDMSAFCTHELHAVRAMAYRRSRRRYSTHTASWKCRPEVYSRMLEEGDIVRLTFNRVASDGSTTTHDYLYQLDQIIKSPTGEIEFQATHFPIDATGRSVIALDVMSAQAQGYLYSTIRTGLNCDDDSLGERATDTSVPESVGQIISPGAEAAPPSDPPTLPLNPRMPNEPNPPETPPGGYNPPGSPPSTPTPPDEKRPDPCAQECIMRTLEGGTDLPCPPAHTNVGFLVTDENQYTFCQTCSLPQGQDCYPLDCCGPEQIAAGYQCSTYATLTFGYNHPSQGFTPSFSFRARDGAYAIGANSVSYTSTCGQLTTILSGAPPDGGWIVQRNPAVGFLTSCFPC